ncbi:hypothetical protein SAMN05421753_12212 [Planctomicrobium piriforme]|uniref:Uncharacterized protein n=2 Tax=Planctomicrobium piriforme TaxID=1576369 RepID=A0A1I3RV87_9PLAN|nr:hypothetical protein SAMN05421753_12212 [Planctomicrobium piriforme]
MVRRSSSTGPAITILAFLCHRDVGATDFAKLTFLQLQCLKNDYPDDVDIYVGWDDPHNASQSGEAIWFAKLEASIPIQDPRQPIAFPPWRFDHPSCQGHQCTAPLAVVMEDFLKWMNPQLQDLPARVFIFSGHGTPGYGLGQYGIGISELMWFIQSPGFDIFADQWRSSLLAEIGVSTTRDDIAKQFRSWIPAQLFPQLKALDDDRIIGVLKELFEVRERLHHQPRLLEVGVTLLAAGASNRDILRVREFRRLLEAHVTPPLRGTGRDREPLDVLVLQACSLGLLEVAYELKDVCKSLVTAINKFYGDPGVYYGIENALRKADISPFHLTIAFELVQGYFDIRQEPVAFIGMLATRDAEQRSNSWSRLNRSLKGLFHFLLQSMGPPTAREQTCRVLTQIRELVPRAVTPAASRDNIDLNRLAQEVLKAFPGYPADTLNAILQLHANLVWHRHMSITASFSGEVDGLSLYFPRSRRAWFDSYGPPNGDEGFEFLRETEWHLVLQNLLEVGPNHLPRRSHL